jgi:hypothetical protein
MLTRSGAAPTAAASFFNLFPSLPELLIQAMSGKIQLLKKHPQTINKHFSELRACAAYSFRISSGPVFPEMRQIIVPEQGKNARLLLQQIKAEVLV